ncbi:hypothetical protein K458DRAFT_409007 [Lentithecium fluviatile CBS 122367]|uniref:Peptidase S59 domain-containing protein n=1 Tax=Lentithecium fluviatile CBS 122367 TaxID=1168545 RepID=A0A6G1IJ50_9PLEO|nr:hypothetical protein K458DRAFT_409007 [Lentithecium fluviatile CBS 122367]
MSFGSGGFGGFGSNNNQPSTFGGFGANNNTSSGFGSNSNSGSIFGGGSGNTGGNMFGSNTNTTSSPFGGGGGFGNTQTSFGSKPFGSTGGGLFGGGASSGTAFGGFGATSNTNTSTGFGGGNTSGGLFGQNKTGFGASSTNTGGSLFGGGATNTSSGFGNTSGGFGASSGGAFGASASNAPNNGTATTPFQAFQEKETGAANAQAQYQTITFQQPYQNYSLEELRMADYNQGRRYGNQNGQAGAFGQSTGFGGFGANTASNTSTGFGSNTNTGGGMFGNTANTGTSFGASTGTGFGASNTGGGNLFGQKPAGGLFGSTTTQAGTTGGGLFGGGSNTNTGGAFGSGGTGFGASTGGGLFGQNAQTQNKPSFGGFGNTNTTTSAPFGGSTLGQSNTSGGLFGGQQNQPASTGFGTNTQPTGTGGGLFGNTGGAFGQNQQNQAQAQNQTSGGLFGGGGFGQNQANQQKPGGLFGSSTTNTTGGGLFGNAGQQQQQQQTSGGLFGQNKPSGGLFGSSTTNQPATSGGLFGNTSTNTGNTGGGLFGVANTQNTQQNTGGGLFGASTNTQKPGGLFGGSTNTNNGGGLFSNMGQSNTNQSNLGGSLFGSQNQQQQNQQPAGNSLFGASGNSLLQTSMNTNPYGNDALFAGLATPAQSPGPLATPLSSSQKNRKSSILPQHKLNPSQSTRLLTPQGKRAGGYGFTYSTYGTPTSASSQSSPLSGSLFSPGSLSRSLGKSLSTSNLRNSFTPDTSILAPGAFSTTGRSFGSGSLKKLNINRSINSRPSLFDDASPAKRVSFAGPGPESRLTNGSSPNGASSGALVVREESRDASPAGSSTTANGETNGTSSRPEMTQVNGNELTPVPENVALAPRTSASLNVQNGQVLDPKAGPYYSSPSLDELKRMDRRQLSSIPNFIVGREKIGKIEFNMGKPVDLSNTPLDKLFGDIVQLNHRNATCYGETCSVVKPPLGSGLNHKSRVTLGNSWPRGTTRPGRKDTKHLERLKRVNGTNFEEYRPETGEWVFTVPHFSTYGFDYDDDEDESSPLSAVPDTPAQQGSATQGGSFVSPSESSPDAQSSPDDTFDFKKGMRKRASVPGQFGDEPAYEEDEEMEDTRGESFLGERSVGSLDGQQDYSDESGSESGEDQDMADSVSGPIRTTERAPVKESDLFKDSVKPKSILKTSQILRPTGTPSKGPYVFDDDWANTLQRTISPKKQDRQALRETQGEALRERDGNTMKMTQPLGQTTKTTMDRMDLMDSLFGETAKRKDSTMKRAGHGMQYPYAKRPKTSHDLEQLTGADKEFHSCNKPHFSETGVLVYASKNANATGEGLYRFPRESIASAEKDIRFKKLPTFTDAAPPTLDLQKEYSKVLGSDQDQDVPRAKVWVEPNQLDFAALADSVTLGTPAGTHEQQAWKLLSLLFDAGDQAPPDMNRDEFDQNKARVRKEQLSEFWKSLVYEDAQKHVRAARTPEEKAIAYLSCNSVADACNALLEGFDLRLATMVAQIGGDLAMRQHMTTQIDEWRRMDVLAEMDEPVRALYELIAGNCAQSEGKTTGGRENRASTFNIASHFNLDWRRAFGLRLWYGIYADEPIEMAVAQYADALAYGKEDVKPIPWFVEQGVDMGWNDPEKENREDLLWGVLKLYASAKMELPANVEDVLAPENVSGHPLNARLSFQLFQIFRSRREDENEDPERIVGMPAVRSTDDERRSSFLSSTATDAGDDQAEDPLVELGDKLTATYAASLHTPEHWTTAAWVYMHLSSASMRAHYLQSLLNQFSATYSLDDSDPTYTYLTRTLLISDKWLHAAAALQAKTKGDALGEAMHLIKADQPEQAHEVLCRSVGPESIISRDYDALRELMGGFIPTPTSSPVSEHSSRFTRAGKTKEPVQGWNQGGALYFDYIELLDLTGQRSALRVDEELNGKIEGLLAALQTALEVVARDRWDGCGLEERVALSEIAGVVAGLTAKNKDSDRARILRLPLTEDKWLRHGVELSKAYYRDVMAGGR